MEMYIPFFSFAWFWFDFKESPTGIFLSCNPDVSVRLQQRELQCLANERPFWGRRMKADYYKNAFLLDVENVFPFQLSL